MPRANRKLQGPTPLSKPKASALTTASARQLGEGREDSKPGPRRSQRIQNLAEDTPAGPRSARSKLPGAGKRSKAKPALETATPRDVEREVSTQGNKNKGPGDPSDAQRTKSKTRAVARKPAPSRAGKTTARQQKRTTQTAAEPRAQETKQKPRVKRSGQGKAAITKIRNPATKTRPTGLRSQIPDSASSSKIDKPTEARREPPGTAGHSRSISQLDQSVSEELPSSRIDIFPDLALDTIELTDSDIFYAEVPEESSRGQSTEPDPTFDYLTYLENLKSSWGYLPPFDEETALLIEAIMTHPEQARSAKRIGPDQQGFHRGLQQRGVYLKQRTGDPLLRTMKVEQTPDKLQETPGENVCYGNLWKIDQIRCVGSITEHHFQRTMMINLLSRHYPIWQPGSEEKQFIDFSVEEFWTCAPMPTLALEDFRDVPEGDIDPQALMLTMPRPDLSVYFTREALIEDKVWRSLPHATQALACYESLSEKGEANIFHFLTVECKNSLANIDNPVAKNQSLNNASQALFNMYEFFKDAGERHLNIFFERVRFFSAVATSSGILFRIHRTVQLKKDEEDDFSYVMPKRKDYNVKYIYEDYARIDGSEYLKRDSVMTVLKAILNYASETLAEDIKNAAMALARKLMENKELSKDREDPNHYRYGQTRVKNMYSSKADLPVWEEASHTAESRGDKRRKLNSDQAFE